MTIELPGRQASTYIRAHCDMLAKEIAARVTAHFRGVQPCGVTVSEKSVRDVGYHLMYLSEALWASDPLLFVNYAIWVKVLFAGLQFDEQVLPVTWNQTVAVLQEQLPPPLAAKAADYVMAASAHVDECHPMAPTHLDPAAPCALLARAYIEALLRGERQRAAQFILQAVHDGVAIKDIYSYVFQPVQYEIGRLWQMNQVTVAQEHYCTAATQLIMSQLYPYIFSTERVGRRMVAASVGGELHELGIRMVTDFFELEGWDTYYLGANTPAGSVADAVITHGADLLAVSATLTPHIQHAAAVIAGVRERSPQTRIMVGGYPFNVASNLWREVGADAFAHDAVTAVAVGNQLVAR